MPGGHFSWVRTSENSVKTKFAEDSGSSRWVLGKLPNGHGGWVDAHDRQTDVDLEILDVLREGPKSAYRLAAALTRAVEVVGTDAVRERLRALASCGLVVSTASGHEAEAGEAEAPPLADPWRITEEGRALVEPEAGVASAPYDREVGGEEEEGGGRDAGLWVLVVPSPGLLT